MESTQGTDYAAPRGTPITTTGTVIRTGYTRKRQLCKVKHNNTYSTQYTHVLGSTWSTCKSRMLLVGLVVQAWQQVPMFVIVLENGRQVDALKLKLPGGEPMKS
jgi:hypothetical protein